MRRIARSWKLSHVGSVVQVPVAAVPDSDAAPDSGLRPEETLGVLVGTHNTPCAGFDSDIVIPARPAAAFGTSEHLDERSPRVRPRVAEVRVVPDDASMESCVVGCTDVCRTSPERCTAIGDGVVEGPLRLPDAGVATDDQGM